MKCIFCSHSETKVIDSRESEDLTRRRRECLKCEKRFTTYEHAESPNVYVIKKNGSRDIFNRAKLKLSFQKACEKRQIPEIKIENAINKIEAKLRSLNKNEVQSKALGEEVMKNLKAMDKVAYIRFASVYREFAEIEDFKEEIKNLIKK